MDSPPVRIIEHDDRDRLLTVLRELLDEDIPLIPLPEFDPIGLRPRAVGAKTARIYFNRTRCFHLEASESRLLLEEMDREGISWMGKPLWRKRFEANQLDRAVDFLIRKTK